MAIDTNKWLKDNLAALNLSDEDRVAAERLFAGNLGRTLGASVYPQQAVSDLQSSLDRQKNDYEAQQRESQATIGEWQRWGWDIGRKYQAVDDLEAAGYDVSALRAELARAGNGNGGNGNGNGAGNGAGNGNIPPGNYVTQDQLQAMLISTMEPMRKGLIEFAEFIPNASYQYAQLTNGKPLDAKKFREFAYEHRNEHANMQGAFDAFTADERSAKAEADRKKWETDKEREIRQQVMSSMNIPEASPSADTGSPFFEHAQAAVAAANGTPSRDASRQEFARKYHDIPAVTSS